MIINGQRYEAEPAVKVIIDKMMLAVFVNGLEERLFGGAK